MSIPSPPPVVLTIAGYDPSSGAGITADIKTIAAHGCFGVSCITALTVQSTRGVKRTDEVPVAYIREALAELADDLPIAAVHVGMLGTGSVAGAVAKFLEERRLPNVVVDPVLKSSSGSDLIDEDGLVVLRTRLFPIASIITPNLDEAAILTGGKADSITNLEEMKTIASRLHLVGAVNVVITGGHLPKPLDLLSTDGGNHMEEFPGERIDSRSTHGTGCAFSTSLACQLALGKPLAEAVRLSGEYVRNAIRNADPIGKGTGPVNHFPS